MNTASALSKVHLVTVNAAWAHSKVHFMTLNISLSHNKVHLTTVNTASALSKVHVITANTAPAHDARSAWLAYKQNYTVALPWTLAGFSHTHKMDSAKLSPSKSILIGLIWWWILSLKFDNCWQSFGEKCHCLLICRGGHEIHMKILHCVLFWFDLKFVPSKSWFLLFLLCKIWNGLMQFSHCPI